ncbi:hypothetical protein P3T76_010658 [Phytophthora citrophthora]|uniref:RWP-RK domain-containing protein n=1 Tax=Phytophthora citrophthora TaxID=4793 RepID=A0AAD9GBG6_9STRA|nr:hypothetical protein P3T76_010658 [Phytophthora citrophthora]
MNVTIPSSPSSPMMDSESPRAGRKSRVVYDFPIETLREYSIYRQDDAAEMLGVASITLKRICRRKNYRWTYRAHKAQLRREKLASQKVRAAEALQRRRETPTSPSLRIPEVLLSLSQERSKAVYCSPTSVSDVPRQQKSQFPLTTESRTSNIVRPLPPLSQLLKKHRASSFYSTPDYKSPIYGASFYPTAPQFPSRSLARPNGFDEPTHV